MVSYEEDLQCAWILLYWIVLHVVTEVNRWIAHDIIDHHLWCKTMEKCMRVRAAHDLSQLLPFTRAHFIKGSG